jgi:hypothetical protein
MKMKFDEEKKKPKPYARPELEDKVPIKSILSNKSPEHLPIFPIPVSTPMLSPLRSTPPLPLSVRMMNQQQQQNPVDLTTSQTPIESYSTPYYYNMVKSYDNAMAIHQIRSFRDDSDRMQHPWQF